MKDIKGTTRVCGLIGKPVEHTCSPAIHNTLSELLSIDEAYVPFLVDSNEALEKAVKGAYALNVLGLNVTVPYKNEVIKHLCEVDELAASIGAVNTLVYTDNGYKGYNTDMLGLGRAMEEKGIAIEGEEVLILGAGGAARAVAFLCVQKKAKNIYILNRTVAKAEEIVKEIGQENVFALSMDAYKNWLDKPEYKKHFLVIQATSVGLSPNDNDVIIDDKRFYELVLAGQDLIYKPANTRFMQLCVEGGASAYNGLDMLLYQGIIAYELWNNISVSRDVSKKVHKALEEAIKPAKGDNMVLVGFMGCGKSSLGMKLSYRMRRSIIDTDKWIEQKEGMAISEIFATKGEAYFRELETKCIKELIRTCKGKIISTGGGMPVKEENRELLKQLGTVFYLKVSPKTVYERLKNDTTRPLLQTPNPLQTIEELLGKRKSAYEACADVIVHNDGNDLKKTMNFMERKMR